MLLWVGKGGRLSEFSMGNVGGVDFSLLFANDTLIFNGANPNHFCHLCCLFLCYGVLFFKTLYLWTIAYVSSLNN
jgi:hypothetical protein